MADLLITNAAVATLAGPPGARDADASTIAVAQEHAVAVEGSRISWVGPAKEWDGEAKQVVDADGRLVTPGFVDSHTHLIYAGDRAFELPLKLAGKSYMEILEAGGGIAHTTMATRAASVGSLVEQALPRAGRMLAGGTTCMESKSGYALDVAGELRMLEASAALAAALNVEMVHTFLGAHAVPQEYQGRVDDYVDHIVDDMLPAVATQGIASFVDAFVEEGVFGVEHGERIFEAARRHGLRTRLHADEIVATGGAELAARAGCISADHLLRISEAGIEAMAEAGTIATLMPTVPLTLMRPEWPPAEDLRAAGVPIALASDHNPNNPTTQMSLVLQLGCYALGMTPDEALTAATWNGACALGVQGRVGSIEAGKRADLIVHEVSSIAALAYEPGRVTAGTVIAGGVVR